MDFQKHETLFLFLSTTCPHCRNVVPEIGAGGRKVTEAGWQSRLVFEEPRNVGTYYESLGLSRQYWSHPEQTPSTITIAGEEFCISWR